MKVRFIIAMAIGAFISMIFPSAWAGWELPGMIAALLTGPNSSNILVLVIIWAVNAVVYGLVAFAVILAIP